MSENTRNRWICQADKTLIDSPVVRVVERQCRSSEDEREHRFYVMRSRDWCNIIPITADGKVVFVRQFRIGIDEHTLEIPGGVMDASDEDPQSAAIREMTEETGYAPADGFRCASLGWTHPNPAIIDNQVHLFIAGPVQRVREQKLDYGEMIDVVEIPIEELPERILKGEITHALMLNAFFMTLLRDKGSLPLLRGQLSDFRGLG